MNYFKMSPKDKAVTLYKTMLEAEKTTRTINRRLDEQVATLTPDETEQYLKETNEQTTS